MPKLPKNIFSFVPEGIEINQPSISHKARHNFETNYPDTEFPIDPETPGTIIHSHIRRATDAAEEEIIGKRLFLEMLTKMMQEEGSALDAKQLFRDVTKYFVHGRHERWHNIPNIYGSQVMVSLHKFHDQPLSEKRIDNLGPPETTTRFGFNFTLADLSQNDDKIDPPYYQLDSRPFSILRDMGVPQELMTQYQAGFVKMAQIAEHDYLHQIIALMGRRSQTNFVDTGFNEVPGVSTLETHALALHAHICDRLFTEEKPRKDRRGKNIIDSDGTPKMLAVGQKRKDCVLAWAADAFDTIANMQDIALSSAKTDAERAEVKECITYLSEIYAHRFFRVISPVDADLRIPLLKDQTAVPSIADQAERIDLLMPPSAKEKATCGIEGLNALCSYFLKDTYSTIHTLGSVPLATKTFDLLGYRFRYAKKMFGLTEVIPTMEETAMPEMKKQWAREVQNDAEEPILDR